MSGPVETVVGASVVFVALVVALLVPLPRHKPEEIDRKPEPVAAQPAVPTKAPEPATGSSPIAGAAEQPQTESERISQLERTVHEIKAEQQQLADDIRTLVQEIKDK